MVRSVVSLGEALLVLFPVLGFAQQENPDAGNTARAAAEVRVREAPVAQARPQAPPGHPSPEVLAVREGMAMALDDMVALPKAIPTPPAGTWGIVSEGTGGGGIFRDADSEAEAWLASSANGVTGYGSISGGFFQNSDDSGLARLGWGDWGIAAGGNYTGGYFSDADGSGYAWIGYDRPSGTDRRGVPNPGEYGVYGSGYEAGGYFESTGGTGHAYVGRGFSGIDAFGSVRGGYFEETHGSARAYAAFFDYGINAYGNAGGGHFYDADGSGFAWLGYDRPSGTDKGGVANAGEYGVYAGGSKAGGYFEDTDHSGYAYIGSGNYGIIAYGSSHGGYFKDSDGTGWARLGYGNSGVHGFGSFTGGYFLDSDGTGFAYVAYDRAGGDDNGGNPNAGEYGVYAGGNEAGGYFEEADGTGYAYVGGADYGIVAFGDMSGGVFFDTDDGASGFAGAGNTGIRGFGTEAGGSFVDDDSSASAYVAYSTYKISGTGSVDFVQNHPYDSGSVIVYAAPEGDEVATYTRGTARLSKGEAAVPLGETFQWVTNPDIGLTAHLTPRGDPVPLAVVELSTEQMVVRGPDDAPDGLVFDYLVYGLRIGFEETSVVQEKQHESYIPSMTDHRELYERRPDLRRYNSRERFKAMRQAVGQSEEVDLTRAHALRDAIVEFDPAVHELPRPAGFEDVTLRSFAGRHEDDSVEAEIRDASGSGGSRHDRRLAPDGAAIGPRIPVDDDGNVYATSFRPSAREVASLLDVSEAVEPGDVLVIDREDPGTMRRGFEAHDTGVIGVAASDAGVVLGVDPSVSDGSADDFPHRAAVALAGVVGCKVDADYGAIWPGDLLVTSPTPGHAMRTDAPLPGTILGKALEPLAEGTGTIRVLVMLR